MQSLEMVGGCDMNVWEAEWREKDSLVRADYRVGVYKMAAWL